MNEPFFYVPDLKNSGDRFRLDEASSKHCVQVLRRRPGDQVMLTDGKGMKCLSVIENADKRNCEVSITHTEQVSPFSPGPAIAVAFTKHLSRVEWFIEKATEIGIAGIFPLQCARSERIHYNPGRLHNIMVSAMLQSQQYYLPELHETISLEDFVQQDSVVRNRYIAHCGDGDKVFLGKALESKGQSLVLIGPEGDFTPPEIDLAFSKGYRPVSLGRNRLRTETAALVACVLMNAVNPG